MTDLSARLRALCERHKGVTPGPWRFHTEPTASENHKGYSVSKGGKVPHWIATVSPLDEDGIKGGHNAAAIADVPTMLAALREAAEALDAPQAFQARYRLHGSPNWSTWGAVHSLTGYEMQLRTVPAPTDAASATPHPTPQEES